MHVYVSNPYLGEPFQLNLIISLSPTTVQWQIKPISQVNSEIYLDFSIPFFNNKDL